jgi:hypothetical protein
MRIAVLLLCCGALVPAQRFPKSDPERAFADLKIYDVQGSPLRAPKEDWEGARQRAAESAWSSWLASRRSELDEWMAKRQDRLDWETGYWHDFVSPKDGSFLTWTPEPPGEETLSSPSDPKVMLTPKLFGGWVFGFRSRHAEKIVDAAAMWRVTGERKYFDWAAAQLDFYADNYANWKPPAGRTGTKLMWQSLDEANMLVRFVRTARWLEAPEERRRAWYAKLFRPMALLLDETRQNIHNISCWQRSAMAQAALYGGDDELWKRAIDAPFGIRKQIEEGITSDYFWFEQSLGYNSYVVSALLPLFEQAALAGRLHELRREAAAVENLMLAPIRLRFPNGLLPNPADATGGPGRAPQTSILAQAARLFPTPSGLEAAARQRNWGSLLDPQVAPEKVAPLPAPASWNLESSRMAVLRKGAWQVFFHWGQLDASHAQAEALNWEAHFGDIVIAQDPGTVGYGSPLHRGFYQTPLPHNVPVVEGEGQARWQLGQLALFDDQSSTMAARQPDYRPEMGADRMISIEGEKLVDKVRVQLKGDAAPVRRLGLYLSLQGEVEPEQTMQDGAAWLPPGARQMTSPRSAELKGAARFILRAGGKRFRVEMAADGPIRVALGRTPEVPPRTRPTIFLDTPGRAALFTTTIAPLP